MAEPQRIAIVGLGLIGGSLALALRRARPSLRIAGVDLDPAVLQQALKRGAIDDAFALEDAPLDACDAVVLSTPAQPLFDVLPGVAARMRPGALLTDVCGAKERIVEAAAQQDRVVFVGAHPMAGTEFRGFGAADPQLFSGCTVAVCPPVGAKDPQARREGEALVRALWTAAGAHQLLDLEPSAHDRAVTFASHLPYLAAASVVESMVSAGGASDLARELAAGGFRDTTRLAGDGTVGGAAAMNRFVRDEVRALAARLLRLAEELEQDPQRALERLGRLADERRRMKLPVPRPR